MPKNLIIVKGPDKIWSSLSEAADSYGISDGTFEKLVQRGQIKGCELLYTDMPIRGKPVKCLDTGELYRSLSDLADDLGLSLQYISRSLKDGCTSIQGSRYSLITPAEYISEVYA